MINMIVTMILIMIIIMVIMIMIIIIIMILMIIEIYADNDSNLTGSNWPYDGGSPDLAAVVVVIVVEG